MKILVAVVGVGVVSASIIAVVQQSRQARKKVAPSPGTQNELPTVFSNYSNTFKLNTSPPLWTIPTDGRNTTN